MAATTLLLVFIADMIWWFKVANRNTSFESTQSDYLSVFPSFLQSPVLLTLIALVFLLLAGLLYLQTRKAAKLKIISTIGFSLSFTLAFWQLFSLM
ncbi:hypothetical protein [Pedobacter nototheniae]|uniref:hypothetical protein n=1 Tax=Pedobacter nototheniae TaxID=2488994 RepID=UPI00292CB0AB|nr:hypothetical protein [Pedobacter nototheniae]